MARLDVPNCTKKVLRLIIDLPGLSARLPRMWWAAPVVTASRWNIFLSFLPLLFVFYPTQRFNCMPISFVTKFCARILLNDQHVTYTKVRQLKVSYCVFCPSSSSPSSSASSVSSASSSASSTPGFLLRLLKSSSAEESHRHQLGCLLRFLNHHQPSK